MKLFKTMLFLVLAVVLVGSIATNTAAQSLIAGGLSGRVIDPSGAVVPNAVVDLKSLDTGTTQTATSNNEGQFRFTLLKPGHYEISTSVSGFAKIIQTASVEVGQTTQIEFKLEMSKAAETIEVTAGAPLINADPGTVTSFTPKEVELLPTAGGDVTTLAFTAPGVVVAPGTGYGNFTANGLPGVSNLYTVNGENDMDPYFNINNSGATNLTLGSNEVQEATVTTNPYSGQYGQLMGAQVTYVTKSGTNQFHGNAQYWWNGRFLNANNWFNNASGSERPFANANQWAGSVGGPIVKDKLWFFFDTEGLRFVLPNVFNVREPTPAFAAAVLQNIQANQPNELPAYQTIMNLYANAANGKNITPTTQSNNCLAVVLPGWTTGAPCTQQITTTPTALAKEWIIAGRADYRLSMKDDIFFRVKIDHGTQPTYLDPISSNFDALSNQPAYDYQAQERHVFNANMTNAFTASLSHYVAQFSQNAALVNSTLPYRITFADSSGLAGVDYTSFNPASSFPQGRNITQYQFIDDLTWTKGRHNLQFGINFRRYDVSDHNFFYNTPRVYFNNISTKGAGLTNGLQDFADGLAYRFRQSDNQASNVPIALWGMGLYASDTWRIKSNFSLTLALRVERNSNPVCQKNCFANYTGPFSSLASVNSATPGDVPYSSDINYNQHQAYPGVDSAVWSPRVAFSWSPEGARHFPYLPGGGKTVISGGIGIFYDNPAAQLVDNLLANPPVSVNFRVQPPLGTLPFDTTSAGSAATFQAASQAFSVTKSYNQIKTDLAALGVPFPAPAFNAITGTVHAPQAQEWNLKVDQQIGRSTALTVNYAGNHVIRLPFNNSFLNAFDQFGFFPGVTAIPAAPPVPNYGIVTNTQSGGVANYNGVTFSLRTQISSTFLAHFNYTYSHTFDEISNGGLSQYQIGSGVTSILQQVSPNGLRANYGNAEYDIRSLFSADFVYSPSFHFGNKFAKALLGGWQWSGKVFLRSGLPFTVQDGNVALGNFGGSILGNQISNAAQIGKCGAGSAATSATAGTCMNVNAFTASGDASFAGYSQWPSQARNQFRGANYFDMDMALFKTFHVYERASLGIGLTAYNAFNHPNFALPDNILGDPTFGQVLGMEGVPASPYGNFLGFDSSPRVVQLTAKFTF
jgi:hypothetical protein